MLKGEDINYAVSIRPSHSQVEWNKMEFYSFICFGVNTYTGIEWGCGSEDPIKDFRLKELDAEQWVIAIKSAGMKGIILTCKHHDGFCLWPSAYTDFSVRSSLFKNGTGDIVKDVADACKKHDIKFGVYLSPWDRNNSTYGKGKEYDDYFCNQLTELLTYYGDIFEVWFDGACGEGKNGKVQVYDFKRYYDLIYKLQPNAVIAIMGPDVRWCGNESGICRESEWSIMPASFDDVNKIMAESQQVNDINIMKDPISFNSSDLASRDIIKYCDELIWFPCETDVSIRPGWYYRTGEDDKVKSFEELLTIYNNSVGGNSSLLLNVPPDMDGNIHHNDLKSLKELGDYLKRLYENNLAESAKITALSDDGVNTANNLLTEDYEPYFKTKDGEETATITLDFKEPITFDHVVLKENIKLSQRIEEFNVKAVIDGKEQQIFSATTVGNKKICIFEKVTSNKIIIEILKSRVSPTLCFVGVYNSD